MLTELYIEALLANEVLADEVWVLWDAGVITDELASITWWLIWANVLYSFCRSPGIMGSSTN